MYAFDNAPRCGAKAKVNNGEPCRCPAVKGKSRCRLHGGAKGSGAPQGNINAVTHGGSTSTVKTFKRKVKEILELSKTFLNEIG
jgi:glucans biosynthesis protein